jgi:hypothetical protein
MEQIQEQIQQLVREVGSRLAMPVRGFPWIGPVLKPHRQHFVEFWGWDGEIYVRDRGLLSLQEYYRLVLNKGLCLWMNGYIIGPTWISTHYNSLHREYLGRFRLREAEIQKKQREKKDYAVIEGLEAVFESAVELYRQGVFDEKMLKARIWRYVKPEHREHVFAELVAKKGA